MCVHIHSRVISFLIPPASTSAPGPLVDKETGIHRHFRRQELVNSNGFRVGLGEIHSCHPKKELGAQRLFLRSTRELQIHWEIRRSEVAAGEGRKWSWVYKVSFWLCGFQLDLPVGEAAGSGSCFWAIYQACLTGEVHLCPSPQIALHCQTSLTDTAHGRKCTVLDTQGPSRLASTFHSEACWEPVPCGNGHWLLIDLRQVA